MSTELARPSWRFGVQFISLFAQTTEPTSQGSDDLLSELGSEIQVVLDRWSAGQIGVSELLIGAGVIAVAALCSWLVRRQARRVTAHLEAPAATAGLVIGRLVSLAIYLLALGLILEVFGFSVGPVVILVLIFWAAMIIAKPLMLDLNSGLILQLRGSLVAGDVIETNGVVGTIQGVNTRSVVLVTSDGKTVEIPSREVIERVLVNFTTLGHRRSELTLRLPESADVDGMIDRLRSVVEGVGHVLDVPPPEVVVSGFDGTSTSVTLMFWHGPELWEERLARDRVGRAVLDVVRDPHYSLADPAIVVRSSEE
ncbi:MAG: mechanosensitive ion channel family protein [Acidimicrobiales bacterium]